MKQINRRRTLFGEPRETSAVFCIDRSGSIYKLWDIICTHLIEHLCKMAIQDKKAKFNVVVFDDQVESFRVKMTKISTQSIIAFRKWFQLMCHGSTSYLLPALMASFGSTSSKCVYLVTDGLTSNESPQLFVHLPRISNGRPLHCILLNEGTKVNPNAIRLMAKLTSLTCCPNSSLKIVRISYTGALIQISPDFWCPRIPAHLYGNPEVCFAYIMNSLLDQKRERPTASTCDAGVETNASDFKKSINYGTGELLPSNADKLVTGRRSFPHIPSTCENNEHPSAGTTSGITSESFVTDNDYYGNLRDTQRHHQHGTTCAVDPECCVCNRAAHCTGQCTEHLIHDHSQWDSWKDDLRCAPSAGTLLLGRQVLAPNQMKQGALYLATVLSQLTYSKFLVSFESSEIKIPRREDVQEQNASDLISFLDYYRHSIEKGDFVLLPRCALNPEESSLDEHLGTNGPGYFLEPYILAQVVCGTEARGKIRGSVRPDETIHIKVLSCNNPETSKWENSTYTVRPNTAIWVPPNIANRIRNGFTTNVEPGTVEYGCDEHGCHGPADILVLTPSSRIAPFVTASTKPQNIPAAYSLTELNHATESLDKIELSDFHGSRIPKNSPKSGKSFVQSEEAAGEKRKTDDCDQPLPVWTEESVFGKETVEASRLCRQFRDACTSADNDLKFGSLSISWKRQTPEQKYSKKRPGWRYWGAKSIPSLLDPPIFEPYRDTPVWGKFDRIPDQGGVERPEIHFTKVTHKPKHAINFRDSVQVYMALRDPTHTQNVSKAKVSPVNQSETDLTKFSVKGHQNSRASGLSQADVNWSRVDSVRHALQDYHREKTLVKMEQKAINQGRFREAETLHRMLTEH
ncbi:hypothetical protein FGIG_04173 [Fasciola gigantica]|uniref:VWFA domain-containing protein n=1 Tax=Fasciola gigantica TaxID=46835 RepID=A0A504YI70_FASGI|nr:hypothetical protein FGIG_04173 [Fasciola gigantica]